DDYSRFTWVFFSTTKDETGEILKNFIKEIENLVDKRVKIIKSDNGIEFKNKVIEKGIKREYSVARTPQQNGVAERRNRTLIEAAKTMLANSKLFRGFKPTLSFMRPFECHVTILNTLDSLGKFDGKSDEENKPMIEGNGPKWLFDIDSLTQSMNYVPVAAGTIINESAGTQGELNAGTSEEISQDCIVMPIWKDASYFDSPSKDVDNGEPKSAADDQKQVEDGPDNENDEKDKYEDDSSPKEVNTAGQHVNTASPEVNTGRFKLNIIDPSVNTASLYDQDSPKDMFTLEASHTLEATHVKFFSDEDEPEVDLGNITNSYTVPTTPNTRIHKDHPIENVISNVKSSVQIRQMTKPTSEQGFLSVVESMQEELLQFKLQQVWILMDLPTGKRAIGTKWIFINKKEERGIVIRIEAIRLFLACASFMGFSVYQMDVNSAFLYETIEEEVYVTQPPGFKDPDHPNKVYKVVKALYGLHQAPRAWYETLANYLLGIRFKRGKIDQTLFIKKQKGDILLLQVYVDDIIFGSTNMTLCTGFEKLMKDKFQMSSMGELTFFLGLQVYQKEEGIFISQDKYVVEILKKFNYTDVKSSSTLVDLEKPLVKDGDDDDVDIHLYRSMIGSLMYLTTSRPDIMFAVCACARFQVTPKTSHLLAVKRIFRYLKGKPTLGLTYFRDSPFELVTYTDSDYARATQDMKSTTRDLLTKVQPFILLLLTNSASLCTFDDEVLGITATIDRKVNITVSEASIRRRLKLEDSKGISSLPTIEIFEQLALMGYGEELSIQTTPETSPSKITSSPSLSSHHTSISALSTSQPPIIPTEEAAPMPHESPLHSVHSLGRDEGNMQQHELMDLVTKLTDRIGVLEKDLQRTKKTHSTALTRLILRVKKLEKNVKTSKARRRARIVISEDEDAAQDSSKQGRKISDIDTDPTISLVQPQQDMEYDFDVSTAEGFTTASIPVTTASASISTVSPPRVSTAEDISGAETLVYIRRSASKAKDKGKVIMQ
ncbi:putative ribonuclease H-like domain-containing protein, partial [Tanacetum coccineum]